MNARNHIYSLLLVLCACLPSDASDKEMLERVHDIEKRSLGKSVLEIKEEFGKPRALAGDESNGHWFYPFQLKTSDVTRITSFQLVFEGGRVTMVTPIWNEQMYPNIGSFAGYMGPKASEASKLESFVSKRDPKSLSPKERKNILGECLARLKRAEEKHESLSVSAECSFFLLLREIIGNDDPKLQELLQSKPASVDLASLKTSMEKLLAKSPQ